MRNAGGSTHAPPRSKAITEGWTSRRRGKPTASAGRSDRGPEAGVAWRTGWASGSSYWRRLTEHLGTSASNLWTSRSRLVTLDALNWCRRRGDPIEWRYPVWQPVARCQRLIRSGLGQLCDERRTQQSRRHADLSIDAHLFQVDRSVELKGRAQWDLHHPKRGFIRRRRNRHKRSSHRHRGKSQSRHSPPARAALPFRFPGGAVCSARPPCRPRCASVPFRVPGPSLPDGSEVGAEGLEAPTCWL